VRVKKGLLLWRATVVWGGSRKLLKSQSSLGGYVRGGEVKLIWVCRWVELVAKSNSSEQLKLKSASGRLSNRWREGNRDGEISINED
jgi:hypothetical protein